MNNEDLIIKKGGLALEGCIDPSSSTHRKSVKLS